MKTIVITLTLTLALSANAFADAPPPADHQCHTSAGTAVIDYGNQSRWQMQELGGQKVTPGKRTLQLNIVCPYTQPLRMRLRGEQASNGDLRYGERGSIMLQIYDVRLDDRPLPIALASQDGALLGPAAPSLMLRPGNDFSPVSNGQAAQGKRLTARIDITPVLEESDARSAVRRSSDAKFSLELADENT